MKISGTRIATHLLCTLLALLPALALAERVKDISQVAGVRGNQLVGDGRGKMVQLFRLVERRPFIAY